MAILRASESTSVAEAAKSSAKHRSQHELVMREKLEAWGRERWPDARVVHELVVGRGESRADMAFVGPDHFVAVEIKSGWDNTARLIEQCARFRLAAPEVWICCDTRHAEDVELITYLLPTIGRLDFHADAPERGRVPGPGARLEVTREPGDWVPHPEALLSLLWVEELKNQAQRHGKSFGRRITHRELVRRLLDLPNRVKIQTVCEELRARDAFWRADPPIGRSNSLAAR